MLHEDSMNKLQGGCVFWLVFLTGAAQLLLVCGQSLPAAGMFTFMHDLCQHSIKLMLDACRSVLISGINQHHH